MLSLRFILSFLVMVSTHVIFVHAWGDCYYEVEKGSGHLSKKSVKDIFRCCGGVVDGKTITPFSANAVRYELIPCPKAEEPKLVGLEDTAIVEPPPPSQAEEVVPDNVASSEDTVSEGNIEELDGASIMVRVASESNLRGASGGSPLTPSSPPVTPSVPPVSSSTGTINFVWISPGTVDIMPLKPNDRFNIFSWRALGVNVKIFTHRRDYAANTATNVHSLETLGFGSDPLEGIEVVELATFLATPSTGNANDIREVLLAWINANDAMTTPWLVGTEWKDTTFNAVDLTKSYLAATQVGITMDSKVGPSEHFKKYRDAGIFQDWFVSYSRGGKTAKGLVENQLMGTFGDARMRTKYADAFWSKMSASGLVEKTRLISQNAQNRYFDQLTSYHGNAWAKINKKHLDTVGEVPQVLVDLGETPATLRVDEIGGQTHGPFRVFKKASDQTNQNVGGTTQEEINGLMKTAMTKLIPTNGFTESSWVAKCQAIVDSL